MIQKFKTKKFWLSFAGVIILMLQLFGVKVDAPYVNEIVDSICAVLILVGLMDGGSKNGQQNEEVNGDTCSENGEFKDANNDMCSENAKKDE